MTAYTPTTSSAITNYIPVMMTAASGVPRLDYDPVTGNPLGLLIEEQRTNLFTYSSDFTNAAWDKSNSTITAGAGLAPDGTQTVNHLTDNGLFVGVKASILRNISDTINTKYAFSVYAKAAEYGYVEVQLTDNSFNKYPVINLSNGSVSMGGGATLNSDLFVGNIGNGWFRITILGTTGPTSTILSFQVGGRPVGSNGNYSGNGYSGIYAWGAQLEVGPNATSYIPTTSAQVTRNVDVAMMTGNNLTSWYNQSQGTFFANFQGGLDSSQNGYGRIVSYNGATCFLSTNGSTGSLGSWNGIQGMGTYSASTDYWGVGGKGAVSYNINTNNITLVESGMVQQSYALAFPTNISAIALGNNGGNSNVMNGHIRKLMYYRKALSSANLIGLTS